MIFTKELHLKITVGSGSMSPERDTQCKSEAWETDSTSISLMAGSGTEIERLGIWVTGGGILKAQGNQTVPVLATVSLLIYVVLFSGTRQRALWRAFSWFVFVNLILCCGLAFISSWRWVFSLLSIREWCISPFLFCGWQVCGNHIGREQVVAIRQIVSTGGKECRQFNDVTGLGSKTTSKTLVCSRTVSQLSFGILRGMGSSTQGEDFCKCFALVSYEHTLEFKFNICLKPKSCWQFSFGKGLNKMTGCDFIYLN